MHFLLHKKIYTFLIYIKSNFSHYIKIFFIPKCHFCSITVHQHLLHEYLNILVRKQDHTLELNNGGRHHQPVPHDAKPLWVRYFQIPAEF